jgi:predicted dehydrogenase
MAQIRIGQIGTAHGHAAGKLEQYRKSPDYDVVGIVEPSPQLRQQAEGLPAFRDVPWMSGLQAVAVETEPRDSLGHAEAVVEAGFHLHLDKPAGESLVRFRKLLDSAARRHLCVQMGYMYRYNPGVVLMKDFVRKGLLGNPFEVHCVMSKVVDPVNRRRHGDYPGGMMFELGCHLIDIVVDLLGQPETVTSFGQHAGAQQDPLLDNMLAVLKYPQAIATVKSSGLEVEGGARRHFVICGTEGTLHIEPLDAPKNVRLALSRDRGKYRKGYQDVPIEPYERYVGDAADFAKVIRGEKMFDWSSVHDLAVQETILKASGCPTDR